MCKIPFRRLLITARRNQGLSQRELCSLLKNFGAKMDFMELSKIENDRNDICDRDYNRFIESFCKIFDVDREYIEIIRQQTVAQPLVIRRTNKEKSLCKNIE